MADARDEAVWTHHAFQHERDETPHIVNEDNPHRLVVTDLEGVKKVMDLGCGSALWRHVFGDLEYFGVDQNVAMIEVAKQRFPEDTFVVCNGMDLAFEDGSFDLIFTASVLQHNRHPDKEVVAREIYRVLRPGGYYLCSENTLRLDNYQPQFGPNVQYEDALTDGYSFTPAGWECFMSKLGFKMEWYKHPSEYLFIKE